MLKNINIGVVFFFILVVAVGAAVRFSSIQYPYHNPDEIITIKVSEMMIAESSLDTNWENADLPDNFKYPQYNFSGYIMFSAGVIKFANAFPIINGFTSLEILRYMSAALGTLVVLFTILLGRQLFNVETGIFAGLIVAVNPLLYQDSLYARPETFVTVLTLLFLYILGVSKIHIGSRLLVASAILGTLVATKVSMLILTPLLLLQKTSDIAGGRLITGFIVYFKSCIKLIPTAAKLIPIGFFIGFFCLAPYAVINFKKFLFGLGILNEQYTTGHWPYGLIDGLWIDRLQYAANYFFPTAGLFLFLMALGGAWLTIKERRFRTLIVFAIFSVFAIRFGTYPTFFERNFSHLLPIFCIFSAYPLTQASQTLALRPAIRVVLLIIGTALVMAPSINTLYILRFNELPGEYSREVNGIRTKLENELGVYITKTDWVRDYSVLSEKYSGLCEPVLLEFPYPNDKYSTDALTKIKSLDSYIEVGRFTSPFVDVSSSTLHTYFTPTTIFLFKDLDFKKCANTNMKFVSRNTAGGIIESNLVYADSTWTKQGSYGNLLAWKLKIVFVD